MTAQPTPLRLEDNRVPVFYRGGERIAEFRGIPASSGPEDWVASTCALPLSMIPDGHPPTTGISPTEAGLLNEVIAAAPEAWLGNDLFCRFDGNPGLLVKLLDAGERLPVHCHPDRTFARTHLGSCFGKSEGWIVMSAESGASVWLGMRETVAYDTFMKWIREGDTAQMLAAMNEVPASPGDTFYVPARLPHAIGEGILVTELQEPATLSISANYREFGLDESSATVGLGWETALEVFDLEAKDPERDGLVVPSARASAHQGDVYSLFPDEASAFFRALSIDTHDHPVRLSESSFTILIVNDGAGTVAGPAGSAVSISAGQTWVLPYCTGPLIFNGRLKATLCLPPSAEGSISDSSNPTAT